MTETRITLHARIKPLADELIYLTGVNSLTNLFALLLTRYGYHLKNSWVIGVATAPLVEQSSTSMQAAPMQAFPSPLSESTAPEQLMPAEEDPVIARLRGYIEDF